MWIATEDINGNVYYYDDETGESTWTLPQKRSNRLTQTVMRCAYIGLEQRLRRGFRQWEHVVSKVNGGRVKTMVPLLDAWQRARVEILKKTARGLMLEDDLHETRAMLGHRTYDLAACRALYAQSEYSRLARRNSS